MGNEDADQTTRMRDLSLRWTHMLEGIFYTPCDTFICKYFVFESSLCLKPVYQAIA